MGRPTVDRRMVGVDCVGDDRGRGVGLGCGRREHGHRVGDAQRERAAAPARGGNAAHRLVVHQAHGAIERVDENASLQFVARAHMEGDVATVIDVGLVEPARGQHRLQHLVGDRAGNGGHGRDVDGTMRPHGFGHTPRHRPLQQGIGVADRPPQQPQLAHQGGQDVAEAVDGLAVRLLDLPRRAECLDQKVDRTVLQVQAAIGKESRNHLSTRTLLARSTSSKVTAREA